MRNKTNDKLVLGQE